MKIEIPFKNVYDHYLFSYGHLKCMCEYLKCININYYIIIIDYQYYNGRQ